ncbi:hypothetical protein RJ640_020355 [Escallonia rubra]|uniref:Protein kinase domain-containing protein n=1 Tax=Escallonia rubra TaxID=112253 RepID=A0AA88QHG7_9ASTE|nr:hypothetical protein RJ640_020355 [Escallonia rubra]
MLKAFLHVVLFICTLPLIAAQKSSKCENSCGTSKHLPYPFGFSSGCHIRLNCTENSTIVLDKYPVRSVTNDSILIDLPAQCGRPVEALLSMFSHNYAPTSHNGILLQNCSSPVKACRIPTTMVQTNFELLDCGNHSNNNTISCYSEDVNKSTFIDYLSVTRTGCRSLLSAIATGSLGNGSAISLDVQVVELGWWLDGESQCSDDAERVTVLSPLENWPGYRCRCLEGFVGDGYRESLGCRKESSRCSAPKYLSGHCGGTTRVGVLIGGVAAGACLMISVAMMCCFIRRRSHLRTRNRTRRRLCEATGISIPIYPYEEMEKATMNFSDKRRLGTGAYGTVYSGKLPNDEWVAIKRMIHRSDTDNIEQVMNEIKLLSSVSHQNLVRLLGCSIENGEQILVFEFMPNGTLSQHLQRERGNGLAWPVRLTIATETAQAIAYLHSAINPPIYHRDIKSSNILLDYNYKSKVADFGLSRLGMVESSHISTAPQGTPGYLDPQYHQTFHLSDKSDVYSFGVVLVEIITALKAVDFLRPQNDVNLASLAVDRIGKGCLDKIIDPFLMPRQDDWTFSSLHKVAELAFRCLAFHSDMRPSMVEVAAELEQIRLSKYVSLGGNFKASSETSSCSSSSDVSEKPLSLMVKKFELDGRGIYDSVNSLDSEKDRSPNSVEDSWLSEESSPSSNSLLGHVIQ